MQLLMARRCHGNKWLGIRKVKSGIWVVTAQPKKSMKLDCGVYEIKYTYHLLLKAQLNGI
jgi:hypothetical protein